MNTLVLLVGFPSPTCPEPWSPTGLQGHGHGSPHQEADMRPRLVLVPCFFHETTAARLLWETDPAKKGFVFPFRFPFKPQALPTPKKGTPIQNAIAPVEHGPQRAHHVRAGDFPNGVLPPRAARGSPFHGQTGTCPYRKGGCLQKRTVGN